jgi:hypothetical protein
MTHTGLSPSPRVLLPLLVAGLVAASCGVRAPRPDLASAEHAVEQAGRSQAPEHAAQELHVARDKLDQARQAMKDKDYTKARRLAEEAEVDAELAQAQASAAVAQQAGRVHGRLDTGGTRPGVSGG